MVRVWVRDSDGEFGSPYSMEAEVPAPSGGRRVVEVPTDPDPRRQKWSGSAVVNKTQAEIDAYDAAHLSAQAERESLTPSVLAMLGTMVRGRMGAVAWTALTPAAKKQAVRDEAAVFKGMREFFDKGA